MREAIGKVMGFGRKLGKPGGIMCHSIRNEIKNAIEDGFKFKAIGSEIDYLRWGAHSIEHCRPFMRDS